jgi:hypothetical protein
MYKYLYSMPLSSHSCIVASAIGDSAVRLRCNLANLVLLGTIGLRYLSGHTTSTCLYEKYTQQSPEISAKPHTIHDITPLS